AGTVVRRNVPPGALAVSGGPQRIFEGWVESRRPGTPAAEAAARARAAADQAAAADGTAPAEQAAAGPAARDQAVTPGVGSGVADSRTANDTQAVEDTAEGA